MSRRSEFTRKDARALCRRLVNNPTLAMRQLEASMYGGYPKLKEPPRLQDFNLSEDILAKNKEREGNNEAIQRFISLGICLLIQYKLAGLMFADDPPMSLAVSVFAGFMCTIPFAILCYPIAKFIASLFIFNKKEVERINKLREEYQIACGAYEYQQKLKAIQYWKNMDGREFEYGVAQYFKNNGYNVELTQYSNDGGVDLILYKGNQKIYVQCKHYQKPVGIAPVRELYGVMQANNVQMGYLVTLNGCTKGVNEFIKDKNIHVYTLDDLMKGL